MAKPKKQDPAKTSEDAQKALQFQMLSRLAKAMAKEYTIQGAFKLGYRNKEDISNRPAYTLVVGSQNVLSYSADRIGVRQGYQLDGSAGNQNTYGIDSSYDFNTHDNGIQNLRKWGTNLECRYVYPNGTVSWVSLMSTLSATNVVNFTDFWDFNTELKNLCLFVNGNNNIYEWTGGVASFASATSTSITGQGTKGLSALNFYTAVANTGKMKLILNGITYNYTGAGNSSSTPFNQAPTNNKITSSPTQWNSQLFTTGAGAIQISTASIQVNAAAQSNVSANFTAGIYTDNAGVPGTLVGIVSVGSVPGAFSSGGFTVPFTFNIPVSPNTNYHFVVYSDQLSNMSVYTGTSGGLGTNISVNSGATWAPQNGYLNLVVNENDTQSTTFVGVTPDPTLATNNPGDPIMQLPCIGSAGLIAAPLSGFDLIGTFRNQVYYGSFSNNTVYISKVNIYTDCTVSTPRVVGEGANATLDATPVSFVSQSDGMYISAGRDYWYKSAFTLSSDLSKESFSFGRIKTTLNQGAQSQGLITRLKNSIVYVSFEQIFNSLGPVKNVFSDPQIVNMSDPIKYDMDAYDFSGAGGHSYYDSYFVYFSIPKNNVVRMYNVAKKYWEAPQILPVGRFYHINAVTPGPQIFGHSAFTNESYQLFVPNIFNDNGNPINAIAAFPYMSQEGGEAVQKKFFNKFFTEGYMSGNTSLMMQFNYDFGGFSGTYTKVISGANKRKIFNAVTDGSLGENPLGSQPIGSILNIPSWALVPKFRSVDTFVPVHCYEYQVVYSTNDVDQNWTLLRYGPAITAAKDMPVDITD